MVDKVKVVRVAFMNSGGVFETHRSYDYFWEGAASVGDFAVVNTNDRDSGSDMFKVTKVVDVFGRKTTKASKWAYAVFSATHVEQSILTSKRAEELRESLQTRLKDALEMTRMQKMVDEIGDTELSAMLAELKQLEG